MDIRRFQVLLFTGILFLSAGNLFSQELSSGKVNEFLQRNQRSGEKSRGPNKKLLWIFTEQLPINLIRYEYNNDLGDWVLSPEISGGLAFAFVHGRGYFQDDGSITQIEPLFFAGLFCSFGAIISNDENVEKSLPFGICLGTSSFRLSVGFDGLRDRNFFIGFGLKMEAITLTDAGTIILDIIEPPK